MTNPPKTLIISQRLIYKNVGRACSYEFEDVVQALSEGQILTPRLKLVHPSLEQNWEKASKFHKFFGHNFFYLSKQFGWYRKVPLEKEHDLLFVLCGALPDIQITKSIPDWRKNFRYTVCWIEDIWDSSLEKYKKLFPLLRKFDRIYIGTSTTLPKAQEVLSQNCRYLPPGVDALSFCPPSLKLPRPIDVMFFGRRSVNMHRSLYDWAKSNRKFYYFDTFAPQRNFTDAKVHRQFTADLIQRTKYFIANKAQVTNTAMTGEQEDLSFRFFEGAAAGAVMLGHRPNIPAFHENFDWPDATIHVPADSEDLPKRLEELEQDPERTLKIRKNNVVQSLLRHDWVYRWEAILKDLDLPISEKIQERKQQLATRAAEIGKSSGPSSIGGPEQAEKTPSPATLLGSPGNRFRS